MTAPIIKKPVRQVTGKTVLYGMLAFFGVIFAVNGAFVYFALTSWPELVSDKAYVEGLNYNATLVKAQSQRDLGWSSEIEFGANGLSVSFKDKDQFALTGLRLTAVIKRPVQDITPIIVVFNESANTPGTYRGAVKLPLLGRWSVMLDGVRGDDESYRMEYEIFVK